MCLNLKSKCVNGKFRTTKNMTIMEHLRLQADRFRKQGRLQDDKMETIIEELKQDMEADGGKGQDNKAT
jgi:hypothetical protein